MDTEQIKKRGKALFLAAALLCGAAGYPDAKETEPIQIVKAEPAGIRKDAAAEAQAAEPAEASESQPVQTRTAEQAAETRTAEQADPETEDGRIDLNSAGSQQLQSLKGIGPAKAAAIIAYREDYGGFVCAEEITQVKGIGPATYEKIKDQIYVETERTGQDQ